MTEVYRAIDALIAYAQVRLGLGRADTDYARNGIFALLGLDSYPGQTADEAPMSVPSTPEGLLSAFTDACIKEGLFLREEGEAYRDRVMGELMLPPGTVRAVFSHIGSRLGPQRAADWFYRYCVAGDYVKKAALDKNPRFEAEGLVITINLSKPEFRDPKKAAGGNSTKSGYPKCTICRENEGFAGRNKRTLRTVDLTLGGEPWFWQFSPYGYFRQHGIAVNCEHTPMHVDRMTFVRLMDFVDLFPQYFIGCNAPLPRIGGSVLAHDHYQGGGEILPMHRAGAYMTLHSPVYPAAAVEVVDWPGTVLRVVSKSRSDILEIADAIRSKWVNYADRDRGIVPFDEEGAHNAVSPTVVLTERGYEMSIILRSNITSEQYPDGVFHAHPEFHIIKKESIGLIEAQGLFILPGRLRSQLAGVEDALANDVPLPEELSEFGLVYREVRERTPSHDPARIHAAMQAELGSICKRILYNTAVFKDKEDTVGFMESLGFTL